MTLPVLPAIATLSLLLVPAPALRLSPAVERRAAPSGWSAAEDGSEDESGNESGDAGGADELAAARARVRTMLDSMGVDPDALEEGELETLVESSYLAGSEELSSEERVDAQFRFLVVLGRLSGSERSIDVTRLMAEAMVTRDPEKMRELARHGIVIGGVATAADAPPPLEPVDAPLGAVTTAGRGPIPIVVVPNYLLGADAVATFAEANAERFTTWAVTPPGFAGSDAPPLPEDAHLWTPVWLDNLERRLVELVEREGIDRPLLAAHGLNVYVAVHLASRRPDLFRGAVAIDGLPFAQLTGVEMSLAQRRSMADGALAGMYAALDDESFRSRAVGYAMLSSCEGERGDALRGSARAVPRRVATRYLLEIQSVDPSAEIRASEVPILAVATADWIASSWEPFLGEASPVTLVRLEGSGQDLLESHAADAGKAIAECFQGAGAGPDEAGPGGAAER